jgi:thiol-disulfide isomerase/thioredoxin
MTTTKRRPSSPRSAGPSRQTILVAGAILAMVVVLGLILAFGPGDTNDDDGGDGNGTGNGATAAAFAAVSVEGTALPDFDDADPDPAVGTQAPRLFGEAPDGTAVSFEANEPTLLVFLAHWCPHCQAEVPNLVDLAGAGKLDGVRLLAVLTGTNADAPNYPPAEWLEREGWPADVLLDNDTFSAGAAYGLTTYPYMVAVAADGTVVGRASGEMAEEHVLALAAAASG